MAGFAGFDCFAYPGAAQMAWLKANTNFVWCGYYLAPAPSHGDKSWMGQRAGLAAAGWGIAPVYVGQQLAGPGSHAVNGPQGTTDGNAAAALMAADGFPPGSCVYLDLEDGPPFVAPRTDYTGAWVAAVRSAGFLPGIYCSHGFAAQVQAAYPDARVWAYKVATTQQHTVPGTAFPDGDPSGSGFPGAFAWQLAQNCVLALPGAPIPAPVVDLDSAANPDPSAPNA